MSAQSSREGPGDKAQEEAKGPPYSPLVPEQWQGQIRAMQQLHVIKFRRIF